MVTPGTSSRMVAVKPATIKQVNTFLQTLPDKPKEFLSLREAVEKLQEQIQQTLGKGYSYQEIAEMLSGKGIRISAFTLKNYVPANRRQMAKDQAVQPPTRATRKQSGEQAATIEAPAMNGSLPRSSIKTTAAEKNGSSIVQPAAPVVEPAPAETTRRKPRATSTNTTKGTQSTTAKTAKNQTTDGKHSGATTKRKSTSR